MAEASTSRPPPPTVTDESEELAAEQGAASTSQPPPPPTDGDIDMSSAPLPQPHTNGDGPASPSAEPESKPDPNALPDNATETLYINNLNEKVQLPVMRETLASLFKPYRPLLPIVAHTNVRMRGQAFISFPDKETANRARKDVHDFPLYGKAMQVSFAKNRSDVVVKRDEGDEGLEAWKKERLEHKRKTRRNNPLRRKAAAKLKAAETSEAPAAKKQRLQMPDEYLPPNNVLFIQNLPDGTTSDDLREVFELHAGLLEIRTIPAKKDIAFVEFADEGTATLAKEALHNFKIDGETKMKVTYARK